jgi:hypothetical protein
VRAVVFDQMSATRLRAVDQWVTAVLARLGPP